MAVDQYQKEKRSETTRIRKRKSILSERVLDLFFPRRCAVCDEPVDRFGEGACSECIRKISYIRDPFCMKCGKQLKSVNEEYCEDCQKKMHIFVQGTALYDYGSMADSVFRFKYAGRQEYAKFYAGQMYERKRSWLQMIKPDALVPVPIHPSRKRKRGYNQAQLIAEELSALSGIPVRNDLVVRVKKTAPQKSLTGQERQNNLKKAFKILQNDVKLSTIVIIDDIYTTGSTVDAMTEVLHQAGISRVYCMMLATGRGI